MTTNGNNGSGRRGDWLAGDAGSFGFSNPLAVRLQSYGMVDPADIYKRAPDEPVAAPEERLFAGHQWKDFLCLTEFLVEAGQWSLSNQANKNTFDCLYCEHTEATRECAEARGIEALLEDPALVEHLADISAEVLDITPRFTSLCLFDGHTHPHTYRLMRTVELIGGVVVMSYKQHYARRRPSFSYPFIKPIIRVPSFRAWPSGHAAQAWIIALALGAAVKPDKGHKLSAALKATARDVAMNRVRAGVHYPGDNEAGKALGDVLWTVFTALAADENNYPNIAALWRDAKAEWPGDEGSPPACPPDPGEGGEAGEGGESGEYGEAGEGGGTADADAGD